MSTQEHLQLVMGTGVRFSLRGVRDPAVATGAVSAARQWLERVDRVFSTYRPDSAVSRLRDERVVDERDLPLVEEVLEGCSRAYGLTDGWFDPWGLADGFDPSGYVKGWALEEVGRLLRGVCAGFLVDAGGDLLVAGRPDPDDHWSVGVRHPLQAEALATVLSVDAGGFESAVAVATSGAYARGPHVRSPRTGKEAADLLSATIVGPDPGLADALATALFAEGLPGLDRLDQWPNYSAFVVDRDQQTWATPGLPLLAAS